MNIRELRGRIKDFPDDMEVLIFESGDLESNVFSGTARKIPITRPKHVKEVDGRLKIASRACKETAGAKKCFILY